MTADLFSPTPAAPLAREELFPGALLLRDFATARASSLTAHIQRISAAAPFRTMLTPGGQRMSVAMTNCGEAGWVSDRTGYRYAARDPQSGQPWPAMPVEFLSLAQSAAHCAGFEHFTPDVCLINRYLPGTNLSLHQDRDEQDFTQPIVSISMGLAGQFLLGGFNRTDPTIAVILEHGDALVFGGPSRLRYHGIRTLLPAQLRHQHYTERVNLTFRKAR